MKRILIIEDDKSIAELQRDYLSADGFSAEIVENGEEGLSAALREDFALVVLDVMLPGMDGFEVCSKLREQKNTPILMVSARRDDIDKIRGLGLGADDYMGKPFSPSELVARVKAHIARYERLTDHKEPNREITIRSLTIDPAARRVFVQGSEVALKNKEFDLLLFFVQNPNIVFSKETLFDRIWGMESLGDTATVTVHVNRVRDKIETHETYIETVWGSGYRFRG